MVSMKMKNHSNKYLLQHSIYGMSVLYCIFINMASQQTPRGGKI